MKKSKTLVLAAILSLALILSGCGSVSEGVDSKEPTFPTESTTESEISKDDQKQDEHEQEEPKQEEPKQEKPKQEEPKQEEPKQEEQQKESPKEPDSVTSSPTSDKEEDVVSDNQSQEIPQLSEIEFSLEDIEEYTNRPYIVVNDNIPYFSDEDLSSQSYEFYSELDDLGRCGTAFANIGIDLMPTEERGSIGKIKPSGWQTVKYDIVDGKFLYNRCHLIGYQLSGENANEKNLITGTRYFNTEGMLPFENMIVDYVKETENHVLYRVTPIFANDNLIASGVLIEAESVENHGDDILFCVYIYNVQPGIMIDYSTGESVLNEDIQETEEDSEEESSEETEGTTYILNTNTKKFHYPSCSSVDQMKESNKQEYTGNRNDIISQGYDPCKRCNP